MRKKAGVSPTKKGTQSFRAKDTQGHSDRLFEISWTGCGPAHPGCHVFGIVLPIVGCGGTLLLSGHVKSGEHKPMEP